MAENLEKKIVVFIVVTAAIAVIAGTLIYQKKTAIDQSTLPEASLQQIYDGPSATTTTLGSSSITFSNQSKKQEEVIGAQKSRVKEIKWEDLYKLDYKTGKAPDELKRLHKTKVRLPGFVVPLSDDLRAIKEFLLVPNAQACIHVPPPPPNLIVYAILDKAIPSEKISNPSWLEGTLLIETSNSEYGAASYKILADKIEEYKF